LSARKTARGIDPTVILAGSIHVPLSAVSSVDKISIGLGYVQLRARTDNPPTPPKPTLNINSPFVRTAQVSLSSSADPTARLWCVTTSSLRPTSTSVPCPGFENNALTSGWVNMRPTTFDLTSSGLLPTTGQVITVYLWIANSDLKINTTAGTGTVTFDSTAPTSPALSAVTLGTSQIADLTLGGTSETVQWCVMDAANPADVTVNSCGNFVSTKPTFVGLRAGGTRHVGVFVRDSAGNTAASAVIPVNNTLGQITFTKLMNASLSGQGLFASRCVSCHSPTGNSAAAAKWDPTNASTGFSSTVAKKSQILNLISSTTAPHSGLMSVKEQALIKLWFTQTRNPVEL
jgi:hypothetical protein